MSLGPHTSFIVTSYLVATLVVALLIGWIAIDYRNQTRRLRELDQSGLTRALRAQRNGYEMSETSTHATSPRRRAFLRALPLIGFAGLAVLFWFRLDSGDPSRIPSALIGQLAPKNALPPLDSFLNNGPQVPGLNPSAFEGKVSVVNVWASWCVPCHDEAPLLTELARDERLQLVGINYKDAPDNARRFLRRYGNPFRIVGVDKNGRASIEWGVYGVPETFIVGREGTILYKLVGPITPDNISIVLKPEIEKALKTVN